MVSESSPPWKNLQLSWQQLEMDDLENRLVAERERTAVERSQIETAIEDHTQLLIERRQEIERLKQDLRKLGRRRRSAELRRHDLEVAMNRGLSRLEGTDEDDTEQRAALEQELGELRQSLRLARIEIESVAELEEVSRQALSGLRGNLMAAEERLEQITGEERRLQLEIAALDNSKPAVREIDVAGYPRTLPQGAPRRDRCVTCHLGMTGDRRDIAAPFQGHPRLDLFVATDSPHPQERFGCTVCHGGEGMAIDFSRAGHLPRDAVQAEDWTADWQWRRDHLPARPIFSAAQAEANCVSCHGGDWIAGAERLNVGRARLRRFGCASCHDFAIGSVDAALSGPALDRIAAKTKPGWVFRWLAAPRALDPTARMPHFFDLRPEVDEIDRRRQRTEIRAIVTWLWQHSQPFTTAEPPSGNAKIGADLFAAIGCQGCHTGDTSAHGPNLAGLAAKVEPDWLYAWLRDPRAYHAATSMPNLRLSQAEAADLTAFLLASASPSMAGLPLVDAEPRDELALAHLQAETTIEQSLARLEKMNDEERELYLGERSVVRYDCSGCHAIPGLEPIGEPPPKLISASTLSIAWTVEQAGFHPRAHRPRRASAAEYIARPPVPGYDLSDVDRERISVPLLALAAPRLRSAPTTDEDQAIARGHQLVEHYGCRSCHRIAGLSSSPPSWQHPPPDLTGYGARIRPRWLLEYLNEPGAYDLRPWQRLRMPYYDLDFNERSALAAYFAALAGRSLLVEEPPAVPRDTAVGAVAYNILQCARCHLAASSSSTPSPPPYTLARQRLRPAWVVEWILDPQSFAADTAMPTVLANEARQQTDSFLSVAIGSPMYWQERSRLQRFFDSEEAMIDYLSDAEQLAEALRAYLWTLGTEEE